MLDKLIARFGHAAAFQIAEAYAWFAQQMKTGCSDIRCPSPPPADRSSFENLHSHNLEACQQQPDHWLVGEVMLASSG